MIDQMIYFCLTSSWAGFR